MLYIKQITTIETNELDLWFEGGIVELKEALRKDAPLLFVPFKRKNKKTGTFDMVFISSESIISINIDQSVNGVENRLGNKIRSRHISDEYVNESKKCQKAIKQEEAVKEEEIDISYNLESEVRFIIIKSLYRHMDKETMRCYCAEILKTVLSIATHGYKIKTKITEKEMTEEVKEKIAQILTITELFSDYAVNCYINGEELSTNQMIKDVAEALEAEQYLII